jgi:uncharacterized small protein (DUF1192 family)
MFHDEPLQGKAAAIVPGEDLSLLGLEELEERKSVLEDEIRRTDVMIGKKRAGLNAAEAVFRKAGSV